MTFKRSAGVFYFCIICHYLIIGVAVEVAKQQLKTERIDEVEVRSFIRILPVVIVLSFIAIILSSILSSKRKTRHIDSKEELKIAQSHRNKPPNQLR